MTVTATFKLGSLRLLPWRDILIANGFVSLMLGLVALLTTNIYSADTYHWLQESSPDEFAKVVRLAVLVYILYALVMLGIGMVWLVINVYCGNREGICVAQESAPNK